MSEDSDRDFEDADVVPQSTTSIDAIMAKRNKRRLSLIGCVYLILMSGFIAIGAAYIEQGKTYRVFFGFDMVTYDATTPPFVRHVLNDTKVLLSMPYMPFLVIPVATNAAVYFLLFMWVGVLYFAAKPSSQATPVTGTSIEATLELRKKFIDPSSYHIVSLAFTRMFPDLVMACLITTMVVDRNLISMLYIVGSVGVIHLCYLIGDAFLVHIYAWFGTGRDANAVLVITSRHYATMFAITSGWVMGLFAIVHPLRASMTSSPLPIDVLPPVIIFLTKLAFDSTMHFWNVLNVMSGLLEKTKIKKLTTDAEFSVIAIHVIDAVLFWLFIVYMNRLFASCVSNIITGV